MAPQITLNELYSMRKSKQVARRTCFDRVLELVHRRIRTVASYGGMNTFFEVPGMLIGYPLYDLYECLNYVVEALRKSGMLIQILPPPQICVIYISWDPTEIQPKSNQRAIGNNNSSSNQRKPLGLPAPMPKKKYF